MKFDDYKKSLSELDTSQGVGLDLIEEQSQDDRHRETEEQAIEAQQEGVAKRAPELDGKAVAADQKALKIGEAGEELIRHRLNLIRHLKAAQQLIHREVSPEQKHQDHGYEHDVQAPVFCYRPDHISPIVLLDIVAHYLLGVSTVCL